MAAFWTEQRKYEIWLEIEVLACEAMAEIGVLPKEDAKTIRAKAKFDLAEIQEIEKRTNHDVIAFLAAGPTSECGRLTLDQAS